MVIVIQPSTARWVSANTLGSSFVRTSSGASRGTPNANTRNPSRPVAR